MQYPLNAVIPSFTSSSHSILNVSSEPRCCLVDETVIISVNMVVAFDLALSLAVLIKEVL